MMTIRSKLLLLLLPTLTAIVCLIALFFYFNWSRDILDSFKSRLQSIVIASAQTIQPQEVDWIKQHLKDKDLDHSDQYESYRQQLAQLRQKLPIVNLYVVQIEPVKEGEAVLLDRPIDDSNRLYEGRNQDNAFRQVFLLDVGEGQSNPSIAPGTFDFSETDEHQVYFTKKAFVTPIYETRKTHERFMSAYAPILDSQGEVQALIGADVSVKEIDDKLQNALLMILIGTLLTILLIFISVFFIADRISQPVQQLNQAALDIAAGNYEANIHVEGPREIVELANTLNVMSECLVEHMSRLKESSLIRERMYGEYECALLLQYYMLRKVVEDFDHPYYQIQLTGVNLSKLSKGLLLKTDTSSMAELKLALIEAKKPDFASLYELNQAAYLPFSELEDYAFIDCHLTTKNFSFQYALSHFPTPLFWSMSEQKFIKTATDKITLAPSDIVFLYNTNLAEQFKSIDQLEAWLGKVLRHFSNQGLETIHTMLDRELSFIARKEHLQNNFQILSLQVKYPQISG